MNLDLIQLIHKAVKGSARHEFGIAIFASRITLNYAYSPLISKCFSRSNHNYTVAVHHLVLFKNNFWAAKIICLHKKNSNSERYKVSNSEWYKVSNSKKYKVSNSEKYKVSNSERYKISNYKIKLLFIRDYSIVFWLSLYLKYFNMLYVYFKFSYTVSELV